MNITDIKSQNQSAVASSMGAEWTIDYSQAPHYYAFNIQNCTPNVQKIICYLSLFVMETNQIAVCSSLVPYNAPVVSNTCLSDGTLNLFCDTTIVTNPDMFNCQTGSSYQVINYGCIDQDNPSTVILTQLNTPNLYGQCST